jgi:hypothetical protein
MPCPGFAWAGLPYLDSARGFFVAAAVIATDGSTKLAAKPRLLGQGGDMI